MRLVTQTHQLDACKTAHADLSSKSIYMHRAHRRLPIPLSSYDSLGDAEALESELERATRRDTPCGESPGAVPLFARDLQLALLAELHAEAAHIPTSDHLKKI